MLRTFGWSVAVTAVVFGVALYVGGTEVLLVVAILSVLEISLSFDNAVINATVLKRMSELWQKLFLTIGVLIAVFGMRLVFPIIIVAVTAGLSPAAVWDMAVHSPADYEAALQAAHPSIAAFGGMFLALVFLDFIFEQREISWLIWIERPLAKLGAVQAMSTLVALCGLVVAAMVLADPADEVSVLVSGVIGVISYLAVNGLAVVFESTADPADDELAGVSGAARAASGGVATGKAALFLFLYLEVLDASFSFDGVIGAFAITSNIFIIAAGLGVGAMYIRSLTVYLVRRGTLDDYVFLEHGAHYAIGALAVILLLNLKYEIPELVTGLIGVGLIGLAFGASLRRNWKQAHLIPPELVETG